MPKSSIDYSKWDHLDEYDQDSNGSEDEGVGGSTRAAIPRVTRLDAPSRVTFGGNTGSGGNNNIIAIEPQQPKKQKKEEEIKQTSRLGNTHDAVSSHSMHYNPPLSSSSISNGDEQTVAISNDDSTSRRKETPLSNSVSTQTLPKGWTSHGGIVDLSKLPEAITDNKICKNDLCLYWCQDRYSVTFRILLSDDEKKGARIVTSVQVDGILSYRDRFVATGTNRLPIKVYYSFREQYDGNYQKKNQNSTFHLLWQGTLPHPVHLAEDDEDVDWSIERLSDNTTQRYLQIILYKAVPMQGMFLWWKRPLMEVPEQGNNDAIPPTTNNISNVIPSTKQQIDFQQAWEEAHAMFREKRQHEAPPNENKQHDT